MLLARSNMNLQSEQNNKLMNFEAIVAAINHEIKQPLGAIELNSSSAQMILDKAPVDVGEIRAIMDETRDAARRINETLDGFRSLFGRIDQKRQPVDMNELTLDVLKLSRTELNDHGVTARVQLTSELPVIRGDRNQLHQLIYNLVHNAIEAMSETASSRQIAGSENKYLGPQCHHRRSAGQRARDRSRAVSRSIRGIRHDETARDGTGFGDLPEDRRAS